jgi:hypothetical protein
LPRFFDTTSKAKGDETAKQNDMDAFIMTIDVK